jgi:hypothetical protein
MARTTVKPSNRILKGFPTMTIRALFVGTGLLVASFSPAFADQVTAIVTDWNATTRTITLDDQSQFANIAKEVAVPDLKAGDEVTIKYQADEDGIQAIDSVTLDKEMAKRVVPLPPKRG